MEENTNSDPRKSVKTNAAVHQLAQRLAQRHNLSMEEVVHLAMNYFNDHFTVEGGINYSIEQVHLIRETQILSQTLELLLIGNMRLEAAIKDLEAGALTSIVAAACHLGATPDDSKSNKS